MRQEDLVLGSGVEFTEFINDVNQETVSTKLADLLL